MKVVLVCSLLLNLPTKPDYPEAMATCIEIGLEAEKRGVSVEMIAALSWFESRLSHRAHSKHGAIGPLQVLPKFWMRNGENPVEAGVKAYVFWRRKSVDEVEAVAKYNAGHSPGSRSYVFGNRIVALAESFRLDWARFSRLF